MDHVKQILSKEESNFANDIKKLQRNLNSARAVINGTEVSESIAKITYIQEAIKKLRKIVNSGN
jgi:septum formation inhibitor MinC